MQVNIIKAYDYYKANIDKSCNKEVLPFEQFAKLFGHWINTMSIQNVMQRGMNLEDIPVLTNCGNSKIVRISQIIKKINES